MTKIRLLLFILNQEYEKNCVKITKIIKSIIRKNYAYIILPSFQLFLLLQIISRTYLNKSLWLTVGS